MKGKGKTKKVTISTAKVLPATLYPHDITPKMIGSATDSRRRNTVNDTGRTDRFTNIESGVVPFNFSTNSGVNGSYISIKDIVVLCQKAYYNFPVFRNVIDLMTDFSVSNVYWKGGNKKARDFFRAYYERLGGWSFMTKFFLEYYRSGNVIVYKFESDIEPEDIKKMTQTFGAVLDGQPKTIPMKYIILNPADIVVGGNISFALGKYHKVLNDYEIERLRSPQTDEEKKLVESLPPDVQKNLKQKATRFLVIPLEPSKVVPVFYKKQDYEPLAVPMGYGVLADINWKEEMKKQDMAISRTMNQAILLITMGESPKDGGLGVNPKHLAAMEALFENESLGRVLVADYTTKVQFVIPDIADLLDPKKYAQVDADIRAGLNDILVGSEKFANQSIKVKLFVERLRQGREVFLREFLIPETKRVAKVLGLKNYPRPYFEDIDLKDELEWNRIATRLAEIGMLTPEETVEAIETGRLPDTESSLESQRKLKEYKEEGLYQPVMGGPEDQKELAEIGAENQAQLQQQKLSAQSGRPKGTKARQTTKKVKPIGSSEDAETKFSLSKVKDNLLLAGKVQEKVEKELAKKFKLKELSPEQKEVADGILGVIIANEDPDKWIDKTKDYIASPIDSNEERVKAVQDIAYNHQVNSYLASILYASKL
jgi:hypothetical protein